MKFLAVLAFLFTQQLALALFSQCPTRKVLTYNACLLDHALSTGLPNNRLLRREVIINEIGRLDADIVCLQEIWIGQDVERIVQELSHIYPYSFSKLHLPGKYGGYLPHQEGPNMSPCDYNDALIFGTCLQRNKCLGNAKTQFQIYLCVNFNCYYSYEKLTQKCLTCMAASWENPKVVLQKCAGSGLPAINMRTVNEPGLLLLSKRPLNNANYTDFHPYTKEMIERGFISAHSDDLGTVVCTHLTNNLPEYLEIDLSRREAFSSYLEQGHSERTELIQTFGLSVPVVLAGDFNTGDRFGTFINQDLPGEFCHLAKLFDVTPLDKCTFCWPHENIYTKNSKAVLNTVVDHIFYKGHKVVKMLRVLTPKDVTADGLPLSNHNGVMAVFSLC